MKEVWCTEVEGGKLKGNATDYVICVYGGLKQNHDVKYLLKRPLVAVAVNS